MNTNGSRWPRPRYSTLAIVIGLTAVLRGPTHAADAFIPKLLNTSTIPSNGDLNPYGVAFVPEFFPAGGRIKAGDVVVSNFNDNANIQGTGTTIVSFSPHGAAAPPGSATVFFTSSREGLCTALGVLRGGFVVVGNVPTTGGAFPVKQGALQVIDRNGNLVQTLTNSTFLNGPWDLALDDHGASAHIFVSNVAIGTVTRLDVRVGAKGLTVTRMVTLAKGYTVQPNVAAVILGPTGLAFNGASDTLYVASTADNAIFAISDADTATAPVTRGTLVFSDPHLRGPLGLRFAPNGDLLAANGDAVNADTAHPSEIVEFTPSGHFVAQYDVDASQGGAFGLDTNLDSDGGFNYAVVDDVPSSLSVYRLAAQEPEGEQ
jgi:DNA-binding beta-propeller fold protein YncE